VKNHGTASSAFDFIAPGATFTAVCTDNSTAAGTWNIGRIIPPVCGCSISVFETDFVEAPSGAGVLMRAYGSGTGGSGISTLGTDPGNGRVGLATTNSGHSASYGIGRTHPTIAFGLGAVLLETDLCLLTNPDGTDDFTAEFGFMTKINSDAETDGIWFYMPTYTAGTAVSNWMIARATTAGGASALVDTGVAPTTVLDFQRMTIVVSGDGGRADFYIAKSHVGTVETNLPASVSGMAGEYRIVKSGAGTSTRTVRADWIRLIKVVG
jgi:hypothetical protein